MKKILALAVGMLLIPFTAFGMEMMSDSDMDSITGQSGVAISLANVQVYQTGGDELWYRGGSETAAVGLVYGEAASYTFITAIKNLTIGDPDQFRGGFERGHYAPLINGALTLSPGGVETNVLEMAPSAPRVLSIRTLSAADEANMFGGVAAAHIEIGLPTIEIVGAEGSSEELQIWIGASAGSPVGMAGSGNYASLGTIYTSNAGSTTAVLGGAIGITAIDSDSGSGVGSVGDYLTMDMDSAYTP